MELLTSFANFLALLALGFTSILAILSLLTSTAWAATSLVLRVPESVSTSLISCIWASLDGLAFWAAHIGCLVAFLTDNYVKFNDLSITDGANCFLGVVADNGALKTRQISV